MSEEHTITVLLAVISVSALVMTVILCVTAFELRRMLRRVNAILPHCDETVLEARRALGAARQLLVRTDETTRHVQGVVGKACHIASEVIDHMAFWTGRVQTFLAQRLGNGAGSGPRRHDRRV